MSIQLQKGQERAAVGEQWDVNSWNGEESSCYPPRAGWTRWLCTGLLFAIEETFIPSPFFATFSPFPLLSSLPTPHSSSHNSAWWGFNPAPHFRVITQERDRNKEERLGIFLVTQNERHGQIQWVSCNGFSSEHLDLTLQAISVAKELTAAELLSSVMPSNRAGRWYTTGQRLARHWEHRTT